jgi:predicted nuclease of predicted toxin-antitoxin system
MRVLLDENLDWRLVRYFDADFQVTTVSRQGWKGKRNSELLKQAAATFDVLVTMDTY